MPLGIDPTKPKLAQIEFLDKDIDYPNRIVLTELLMAHRNTHRPATDALSYYRWHFPRSGNHNMHDGADSQRARASRRTLADCIGRNLKMESENAWSSRGVSSLLPSSAAFCFTHSCTCRSPAASSWRYSFSSTSCLHS